MLTIYMSDRSVPHIWRNYLCACNLQCFIHITMPVNIIFRLLSWAESYACCAYKTGDFTMVWTVKPCYLRSPISTFWTLV